MQFSGIICLSMHLYISDCQWGFQRGNEPLLLYSLQLMIGYLFLTGNVMLSVYSLISEKLPHKNNYSDWFSTKHSLLVM